MSNNHIGFVTYELHGGLWSPRDNNWGFRPTESYTTKEAAVTAAKKNYKGVAYRIVETKILSEYIPPREKTT